MGIAVKFFHSGMQGAPAMTNNHGEMVGVLDACLVDGFNVKSVASLTQTGGIATATISAGHLYVPDQVLLLSGATPSAYNGEVRVISTTSTQFTFAVPAGTASPATGTISVSVAPLGFVKAFTGTNKRVYQSANVLSPKPYLRVDNSAPAAWVTGRQVTGRVSVARTMTDVDTAVQADGIMPFSVSVTSYPDWGWYTWSQSQNTGSGVNTVNNGSTPSPWVLVGDDRMFYFLVAQQGASNFTARRMYAFGDIESFKAADQYGCVLWASENYNMAGTASDQVANYGPFNAACPSTNAQPTQGGQGLLRGYTGIGGPVVCAKLGLSTQSEVVSGTNGGVPWPNGPDFSLVISPLLAQETGGHLRGSIPGLYQILNNIATGLIDLSTVDNVTGYVGKRFLAVAMATRASGSDNSGRMLFDITGPWR